MNPAGEKETDDPREIPSIPLPQTLRVVLLSQR
jgi:hypothetical protein